MTCHRHPRQPGSSLLKARYGPISSHEFSATAARDAATETAVREYRGSAKLTPDWRGLIAAQLHGGRVIR